MAAPASPTEQAGESTRSSDGTLSTEHALAQASSAPAAGDAGKSWTTKPIGTLGSLASSAALSMAAPRPLPRFGAPGEAPNDGSSAVPNPARIASESAVGFSASKIAAAASPGMKPFLPAAIPPLTNFCSRGFATRLSTPSTHMAGAACACSADCAKASASKIAPRPEGKIRLARATMFRLVSLARRAHRARNSAGKSGSSSGDGAHTARPISAPSGTSRVASWKAYDASSNKRLPPTSASPIGVAAPVIGWPSARFTARSRSVRRSM